MSSVDLSAYNLDGLRRDVIEIVDVQLALRDALNLVLRGSLLAAVAAWFVAADMPIWATIPFVIVAGLLALVAGSTLALLLVARRRVVSALKASVRVLETAVLIRDDMYYLSNGSKQITTRELASALMEDVVVPALFESVTLFLPGPLGLLAAPIVWLPKRLLGRTVSLAIDHLPSERLDADVVISSRALFHADSHVGPSPETEVAATLKLSEIVEPVVVTVIKALWPPTLVVTAVASIPLIIWLLIGLLV